MTQSKTLAFLVAVWMFVTVSLVAQNSVASAPDRKILGAVAKVDAKNVAKKIETSAASGSHHMLGGFAAVRITEWLENLPTRISFPGRKTASNMVTCQRFVDYGTWRGDPSERGHGSEAGVCAGFGEPQAADPTVGNATNPLPNSDRLVICSFALARHAGRMEGLQSCVVE